MGDRMWDHDWSGTSLGPLTTWPQSLRSSVNIMLSSKQPMFIAWGPDLVFLYNDAYAPILARKHPAALGKPFRDVWSEIWGDLDTLVASALGGEAHWGENLHLVMERNGYPEDTWYSFSYSPVRNDDDAIVGVFCACIETTARVLADRQAAAERDRLLEMTRDLIGVATFDGWFTSINPAWSRVLGRPHDEIMSRPFSDIIHPEDMAETTDVVARLQRGEPVHQFRVRLLKADGEPVSFAWSAFPEATAGSNIFYTVGRDITEELHRDAALRQSQKMEAVGQLTGGIAHDFNNLLQAVHGNLDLIRRRPHDADRVVRLAENGLLASERGAKLTAQLLAFSRAQKLELRPVALAVLVAQTQDMLQHAVGPLIRLKIAPISDDLGVCIDPTQLEMALLNLAINARDAMPDGGDLTITASRRTPSDVPGPTPGPHVEIRVSDTGIGMPPDVAARAFDPFFTTKTIGSGTGLGLSQVYGMVSQAGGTVHIEPVTPTGTSIILLLRSVTPPSDAVHPDAGHDRFSGADGRSVLVVDDDPDVRNVLDESLQTLGFRVTTADSGPVALDILEDSVPDLVILDFAMPGMTGAEVAGHIRRRRPDLPIIFASGYADTAAITASLGPSATLLRKPFKTVDLEAVILTALQTGSLCEPG